MLITLLLTTSLAAADPMLCPALLLPIAVDNTEPWLQTVGRVRVQGADEDPALLAVCPAFGFIMPCPPENDAPSGPADDAARPSDGLDTPAAGTKPAEPPAEEAAAAEKAGEQGEAVEAEGDPAVALLKKLEKADEDLRSFTADIFHEKEDALLGEIVRRRGELIYRVDADSDERAFAIAFREVIANNRKREQQKRYVVSGRWLAEIDPVQKLFVKREIVPPGRTFDPFKLGEGPVPLPIGQSADEVLRRFDVSLTDLPETGPLAKLQGQVEVDGLLLVPKAGADVAEDFARIELFYDRATLLPVGVNVIEVNGDRETARLDNMQRNPQLTEHELEKLDITEPDPRQWRIDIQPLDR